LSIVASLCNQPYHLLLPFVMIMIIPIFPSSSSSSQGKATARRANRTQLRDRIELGAASPTSTRDRSTIAPLASTPSLPL
jgi:hypothetical protein